MSNGQWMFGDDVNDHPNYDTLSPSVHHRYSATLLIQENACSSNIDWISHWKSRVVTMPTFSFLVTLIVPYGGASDDNVGIMITLDLRCTVIIPYARNILILRWPYVTFTWSEFLYIEELAAIFCRNWLLVQNTFVIEQLGPDSIQR